MKSSTSILVRVPTRRSFSTTTTTSFSRSTGSTSSSKAEGGKVGGGGPTMGALLFQKAVLPHPVVVEHLGEIPGSAVREDNRHQSVVGQSTAIPGHGRQCGTRRAAGENSLFAYQAACPQEGFLVADPDNLADDTQIQRRGEEILSNALDFVGRASTPGCTFPRFSHNSFKMAPLMSTPTMRMFGFCSFR